MQNTMEKRTMRATLADDASKVIGCIECLKISQPCRVGVQGLRFRQSARWRRRFSGVIGWEPFSVWSVLNS